MNRRTNRRARAVLLTLAMIAAGLAGEAGRAAAQETGVPVRFGTHPNFERLVFDWADAVGYRVEQQGSVVTITFDRPASFNETQLSAGLSRLATGVTVSRDAASVRITMQLADGVSLRSSRSGPRVVLDFSPGAAAAPAPFPNPVAAAPPVPPSSGTAAAARPWEQTPPISRPTSAPAAPAVPAQPPAPIAAARPAAPVAAPSPSAGAPPPWLAGPSALGPPPLPSAAPPAATATLRPARQAAEPEAPPEPLPDEAKIVEELRAQSQQLATAPPVRLAPPSAAAPRPPVPGAAQPSGPGQPPAQAAGGAAASSDAAAARAPQTPAERSAAFVEAQARRTAERVAAAQQRALGPPIPVVRAEGQGLRFKWPDPVTAAAFTRGPYVFLIFNMRANLDLSAVRNPPSDDLVGAITTIPSEGTTVRLAPPAGTYYAIRRESNDWVVEMTRRPRRPDAPAEVATRNENDPAMARVLVTLRGGQAVITQRDPEVGDELKIVPTAVPGAGIDVGYDFPQFKLLPTAQGLVVKPEADGVIVRSLGPVIEIYSSRGTLVSSADVPRSAPENDPDEATPRIFNFKEWVRDDGRPYLDRRRDLERAVSSAQPSQRNPSRLALARFLFANGKAVEADGALDVMALQQPAVANTRLFRSLKGATSLIVGNLEAAAANLRHATLDREPELASWRSALAMAEGNPRRAIEEMSQGPDLSREYPEPYANRIGLALSEALIELGDIPASRDRLDAIFANDPTPSEESQGRYLRGRLALLEGKPDEAIALWSALERGPPSPARVLAALALVDLQLKELRITQEQAAERIERMRYIWRGDDIEFAVLRKLGELDINSGNVRKGLRSLRDLIALKPDSRDAAAVTRLMSDSFQKYFLEGEADKLTPIAAIGMYNEFRHLVADGPVADAMTRNLADRLIKVDLLDQAADLLEGLVKTRLTGEAKAEAGARLAFTRLLDRKPTEALRALEESAEPALPQELTRDRNRLAARALADLNRAPEGLLLIADDASSDADRLRAEVNWNTGNWSEAAAAYGRLAGPPPEGEAAMSEDQAGRVLRYVAALALAGDQAGLDSARMRYGAAMDRGPFKGVFTVLASDAAGAMPDVRDIQERLSSTAPFQSFLSAYRERFGGGARS